MMWRQVLSMVLCLVSLVAPQARAGAWARDKGDVFLSFGGNVALFGAAIRPVHYDPTLYLEYGATDRLTIGFDGYTADASEIINAFFFVRTPFGSTEGRSRQAVSLAFGASKIPDRETEATTRIGLHWGYGLDRGWLAADATVVLGLSVGEQESKVEATWGHVFSDRWTSIAQLQTGYGLGGDFYAKFSPTILWKVTDHTSIRVGFVQALTGDLGSGLTLETWINF